MRSFEYSMNLFKKILVTSCFLPNITFATSLAEALIHTYQNNPQLIAAREELRATDEQMFKAISGFLPRATYAARKTKQKDDTSTVLNSQSTTTVVKDDSWSKTKRRTTDVNIEQNLFNGGQDVMAVKIAKYTIDAGRERLILAEQEILSEAISAYLGVIYAKQVMEINKENVVLYNKRYESIKERVLAGVDKQADLARTFAGKLDAFTNLTVASSNYESALATYSRVIGMEAENLTLNADELGSFPANQAEITSKALVSNPSLRNIMFQEKAAALNVYSNAAKLLPSVDIGGNIGKSWQQNDGVGQPYTNSKTAYIQISVPIYNRGLEFSYTREASANAAKLKYLLKNNRNIVIQDATKYWNSYVSSEESLKSAKEAVDAGNVALDAVQQSYNEGVDQLTTLLDVQQDLYTYKIKLARVVYELGVSRYNLLVVMGKLNANDLSLETKIYNPASNYDKVKFELIGF